MTEKTRDPRTLFALAGVKLYSSEELLGKDLEKSANWKNGMSSPLLSDASITAHHGGGPNQAGEEIEEPQLTWRQKMLITLGRVKSVLRSWLAYHESKGWTTIAYDFCVSKHGRIIGVLRGWRRNAGQWGEINSHTAAVVYVLGLGQSVSNGGWQALGALWFAAGAQSTPVDRFAQINAGKFPGGIHGHRFWNYHPETQSMTSCPGDERAEEILARRPEESLPRLKYRKVRLKRGRWVRLFNARLVELGYLSKVSRTFGEPSRLATIEMQKRNLSCWRTDGIVDTQTWRTCGKLAAVSA